MESKEGSLLPPALNPLSVARMAWKRRWPIVCIWLAVWAASALFVRRLPKVYHAEAVIQVDAQKIPEKYVASTVSSDAGERVLAISAQLLSGTRLKAIIDEFKLYPSSGKTSQEDIIEAMRKDITIGPDKTTTRARLNAFRVSYEGRDPNVVAQVANRLAGSFIEENLKTREMQAEGTASFIDTQLQSAKERLEQIETALSQYKSKHSGELPGQENALGGAMGRVQSEMQSNADAIERAQQSWTLAQDSMSRAEATLARLIETGRAAAAAPSNIGEVRADRNEPAGVPEREVMPSDRVEAQLIQLRARYSEDHPDVKRLRGMLENLRAAEAREAAQVAVAAPAPRPTKDDPAPVAARPAPRPQNAMLEAQIAQTRDRIDSLAKQIAVLAKEIQDRKARSVQLQAADATYQARMERLPLREQEMAGLMRDYQISKGNYQSLLDKKLAAEMATDLERRQKSERFTMLEPARIPEKPFKPNVAMWSAVAGALALVLGLTAGFVLELSTGHLLGEWELPPSLSVLAAVPEITSRGGAAFEEGFSSGASAGVTGTAARLTPATAATGMSRNS